MGTFYIDHAASWSTSSVINGVSISNGSSSTSEVISLDGFMGVLVSVELTYGGTANSGGLVHVVKDAGGTYENANDLPWGFEMPRTVSTQHRRVFTVLAEDAADFKVIVANPSGGTFTSVIMKYKKFTGGTT